MNLTGTIPLKAEADQRVATPTCQTNQDRDNKSNWGISPSQQTIRLTYQAQNGCR